MIYGALAIPQFGYFFIKKITNFKNESGLYTAENRGLQKSSPQPSKKCKKGHCFYKKKTIY